MNSSIVSDQLPQQLVQNQTTPTPAPNELKSKKKNVVLITSIIAVLLIGIIAVILLIIMQSNKEVGEENVRSYCKRHNIEIMAESGVVGCISSDTHTQIVFMPSTNDLVPKDVELYGVEELEDNNEYKKYFAHIKTDNFDHYCYVIYGRKSYLSVTMADEESARQALIEIGYPDRNWASDQDKQILFGYSTKTQDYDTARRNDISRVDVAMIQYQTNNNGSSPAVSDTWVGTATFNCAGNTASACRFIQYYMNSATGTDKNNFSDPDGTFYNLSIQTASDWEDSEKKDIILSDDMDHTIYIVNSAKCAGTQAQKVAARRFAIFYRLGGGEIYCRDDQ